MPGHHHTHMGQVLPQVQPASIKQFDDLTALPPRHPRRGHMSQHELDLGGRDSKS
jgi:hypothetical protein